MNLRLLLALLSLAGLLPVRLFARSYVFSSRAEVRNIAGTTWTSSPGLLAEMGTFAAGFVPTAENTAEWSAHWTALAGGAVNTVYGNDDEHVLSLSTSLPDNTTFAAGTRLYLWLHDDLGSSTPEHALLTDATWTVATNADGDATPVNFALGATTSASVGTYSHGAGGVVTRIRTTDNVTPVITGLSGVQEGPYLWDWATVSVTALRATGYQWYINGELVEGATQSSHRFAPGATHVYCNPFNCISFGDHSCVVVVFGADGTSITSDPVYISVRNPPPPPPPATLFVGESVRLLFDWSTVPTDNWTVVWSAYATGLPPGLFIYPNDGTIEGVVTGKSGSSYRVDYGLIDTSIVSDSFTVTLPFGSFTVTVEAFPPVLVGSYEALLQNNGLPVGLVRLKVGPNATFTGTLSSSLTGSCALKGRLSSWSADHLFVSDEIFIPAGGVPGKYRLSVTLGRTTGSLGSSLYERSSGGDALVAYTTEDEPGVKLAAYTGKAGSRPAWKGAYTSLFGIDPARPLNTSETRAYPTGSGYARGVVNAKGILALGGRLADSTVFTASLPPAADSPAYRLYTRPYSVAGGYLGGWIDLAQHEGDARYFADTSALFWNKTGGVAATAKNATYRGGFGPLGLDFRMEAWTAPASGKNLSVTLGQAGTGFEFLVSPAGGGLTGTQLASLPTALELASSNKITVALPLVAADAAASARIWAKRWTSSVAPSTGLFTGTFKVSDTLNGKTVTRTATCRGMLLQVPAGDASPFGAGYFVLPPLLRGEASATGSIDFIAQ